MPNQLDTRYNIETSPSFLAINAVDSSRVQPGSNAGQTNHPGSIAVELILRKLAAGRKPQEILGSHPSLPPEAIDAAVEFAKTLPPSHPLARLLRQCDL